VETPGFFFTRRKGKDRLPGDSEGDLMKSITGQILLISLLTGLQADGGQSEQTDLKALYPETIMQLIMEDRRLEMASDITRKKATLLTKKEQVLSSRTSLASRQRIYDLKREHFIRGTETVDNYLQAFRVLVDSMEESLHYENRYLDTLRDFNYICGEYFQFLGIEAY